MSLETLIESIFFCVEISLDGYRHFPTEAVALSLASGTEVQTLASVEMAA